MSLQYRCTNAGCAYFAGGTVSICEECASQDHLIADAARRLVATMDDADPDWRVHHGSAFRPTVQRIHEVQAWRDLLALIPAQGKDGE